MLLKYNSDEQLASADWNLLEFSPEQSYEVITRRIVRKLPAIFGRSAVEIFLCSEFLPQGWILVRSLRELTGLKAVHGLSVNLEMCFDQAYVAQLVDKELSEYQRRISEITAASFVRILDGDTRDYCGHVKSIDGNIATVEVRGYAFRFEVKTPVPNLEDLSFVPTSQQSFFTASIRRI